MKTIRKHQIGFVVSIIIHSVLCFSINPAFILLYNGALFYEKNINRTEQFFISNVYIVHSLHTLTYTTYNTRDKGRNQKKKVVVSQCGESK